MRGRTFTVALALALAAVPCVASGALAAEYEVGVGVRSINPTQAEIDTGKVYLGGFGISGIPQINSRTATGVLGEGASVRAFAVSAGANAFAVADMEVQGWFVATKDGPYGIIDMRKEVERRTGGSLPAKSVVIQSDHTHSGADAMGVWGGIPLSYRKRIFDRTVDAVVAAWDSRRAGTLYYGEADGTGLLSNQFEGDPGNQAVDGALRVLQARDADGDAFATLLNFSAHTTVLGSGNRKVSGDWVQRINPMLEQRLGGAVMTMVGTLGRTQPRDRGCEDPAVVGSDERALCDLDEYASRVTEVAQVAVAASQPIAGEALVRTRSYLIQDPATNVALLGLLVFGDAIQTPVNRAVTPPWLAGNVLGTVAATARIGDVLLLSGPGEMYPQIPTAVRTALAGKYRGVMTAGLANDQLGYIMAPFPEAYPKPICTTLFGNCGDVAPSCAPTEPQDCVSPVDNDNYAFNVSHTLGERLICAFLRGAGELRDEGTTYRQANPNCTPFVNDLVHGDGADVGTGMVPVDAPHPPGVETFTGAEAGGPIKAGAGDVDASYHVGASAGQYASTRDEDFHGFEDPSMQTTKNKPSYGIQARLRARAVVVEGADGARVAFIKNDLYIPQDLLYRRVGRILAADPSLRLGPENIAMMVTHNHSSPYYSSLGAGAWTFQDVFDVRFYEYYAQRMADAVKQAVAGLKPARVGASVSALDKPHRHSFGPAIADDGTPAGYPVSDADHDLSVVRFDDISDPQAPEPLAIIVNYSLHGEGLERQRPHLTRLDGTARADGRPQDQGVDALSRSRASAPPRWSDRRITPSTSGSSSTIVSTPRRSWRRGTWPTP